jgi:hypothetical protein
VQFCVLAVHGSSVGEINEITTCKYVIDGDSFNTTTLGKVRLADIDAPEWNETDGPEATDVLFHKIYDRANKTVFLDVDEFTNGTYRRDKYSRLVCVVYIEHNETHYENVNLAIANSPYAWIKDNTTNEFDPYVWTLYVSKDEVPIVPEFPSLLVLPLFMIASFLAVIMFKKRDTSVHCSIRE